MSVMKGSIKISAENKPSVTLNFGESALIPAVTGNYMVEPQNSSATVLKSYLA